jgi:hypothetical protein
MNEFVTFLLNPALNFPRFQPQIQSIFQISSTPRDISLTCVRKQKHTNPTTSSPPRQDFLMASIDYESSDEKSLLPSKKEAFPMNIFAEIHPRNALERNLSHENKARGWKFLAQRGNRIISL